MEPLFGKLIGWAKKSVQKLHDIWGELCGWTALNNMNLTIIINDYKPSFKLLIKF